MRKALTIALPVLLLLVSISGCKVNYSLTSGSVDPNLKTISISYFPNNSTLVQPTLSQVFTEALRDKFISQSKLELVTRGGDLNIEGAITGYTIQPVAIQGNETAALNRLTITVSVKFTNKLNEQQNFDTNFTRYEDFQASLSISSVEESLIKSITTTLVDDIFNKALVNW